ncbi:glycerophosphodiester phosphodiesterase [Spongiivirga citrea]|uniref:Glycerophosphodiester phosphodiesterase n=1 Tax=Spongiivirga citrea TaxID=1481457 RepID=A0A6M0CJM0_9FLAO|nr:glycerophosphodiester phosphodiesterase [Spongiivirga citrea]NER16129.1 glycerophosphodiester phosphodiesterase [Spongiivirga citrea]
MIDVQGHRGCRGILPENTIPAFKKAIELGVTTLELDLAVSKDHQLVVSHEPFMNHEISIGPNGEEITEENEKSFNLYQMNYKEIKRFDVGMKKHLRFPNQQKIKAHKPLLSEIFDLAEDETDETILYNIEIKSHPTYDGIFTPKVEEFTKLLINLIRERNLEDRVTVQSFDIRALEITHQMNPKLSTALLVEDNENIDLKLSALSFKPSIISPYYGLLSEKKVELLQDERLQVIPWTANDTTTMKTLLKFKVDGIITDYPDRLINLLENEITDNAF